MRPPKAMMPRSFLRLLLLAGLLAWRPAHADAPIQPPGNFLVGDWQWWLMTDALYPWRGPGRAAGVLVWGHGFGGARADAHAYPSQAWVKAFSDAGFDIVRFERSPRYDWDRDLGGERLRAGLVWLHRRGYARVIAAGQSRGGWNALQMLAVPGMVDAAIAIAPAAFGNGPQSDEAMHNGMAALDGKIGDPHARLVFAQFADDDFAGDPAFRARMVERSWSAKLGGVLLIDRPAGFKGHFGGEGEPFRAAFAACMVRFVTAPSLPAPMLRAERYCATP